MIKVSVIGIGGVGGFIAGILGENKDIELTLVARGDRFKALKKDGLILKSQMYGEHHINCNVVSSVKECRDFDVVFVCVKNYSLEGVIDDLKEIYHDGQIIVPIMNGITPGEQIRKAIPGANVVDGVIYIVTFATNEGYILHQGNVCDLRLGGSPDASSIVKLFKEMINVNAYPDIIREIWRKYILNAAYNVETAYYDEPIGVLREDPEKTREYHELILEAYSVAKAKGVDIRQEDIDDIWGKFFEYHYDATSSLQRDKEAGKALESDIFTGYLLREAKKLGIKLPVTEKMNI